MIRSIRHLRGTSAEWQANDIIVPDGEIALVKENSGRYGLKIGNGRDKFSDLPSALGSVKHESDMDITLMHGVSHRCGELLSLTVDIPDLIDEDYYSEISFDSGKNATEFTAKKRIRLTGDGVADEEFMPEANFHYTIFLWYDGDIQGVVRGVPNA